MKIYHPVTGDVLVREPVDCREICEISGYVQWPMKPVQMGDKHVMVEDAAPQVVVDAAIKGGKPVPENAAAKAQAKAEEAELAKLAAEAREAAEALTVSDLKSALHDKGIEIPSGALKADLVELFLKA